MTDDIEELREKRRQELADQTAAAAPDDPIPVDGSTELADTVGQYEVVLVDFYADWCGPCKMLEPILESVASETDAAVAKVDVDRNQQLAQEYSVQGVPTMLLFAGGEPANRFVGVREEDALTQAIAQASAQ